MTISKIQKSTIVAGLLSGMMAVASFVAFDLSAAQPVGFDRLTDADRQAFAKRFEKEIWPLMMRNGKDGCVGCHTPRHQSDLRMEGKVDVDFRMMLQKGFFLPDDPGGMLHAVTTSNKSERMPPGKRPPWNEKEIKLLRQFVMDVEKKQQK